MPQLVAQKTLDKIDAFLSLDQGSMYRGLLRETIKQVEDAYRAQTSPFRSHLGASLIGRECARELWLSFRWATAPNVNGRMLRLFNRGHLEEARFVALLQMIGCTVWQFDENGKQFRIEGHKGHFGGSLDGVVVGVPEFPEEPMVTEFKTHGEKSFLKLVKEGVQKAKPEHFVQMQMYMGYHSLHRALYLAVNKNTDELYSEIISFNDAVYKKYQERSKDIIDAVEPPLRINESPGWFLCRFCSQADVCQSNIPPSRNCRTCRWSTPVDGGKWICEISNPKDLTERDQLDSCGSYEEHPGIRGRA